MSWNREGQHITARYIGTTIVIGMVTESRVAYGGRVKHTIQLDEPREFYGTMRERVTVDEAEVFKE